MSALFTQKHYEAIAEILGRHELSEEVIDAFVVELKADNPKFKPTRFIKLVQRFNPKER